MGNEYDQEDDDNHEQHNDGYAQYWWKVLREWLPVDFDKIRF